MQLVRILAYAYTALAIGLAAGTYSAVHATTLDEIAHGDFGQELDNILSGFAAFGFNGAVLVADHNEIVIQKGYGTADRISNVPFTADTLFDTASCTMQFTAAAILRLEMDGRLSTEDPIALHLPGVSDDSSDVTIYHLLTHTSGFTQRGPHGSGPDLEAAVTRYLSSRRVRKAGEGYEYYTGGYALLAGIVETASGMDYRDYCRKYLFEPAGMTATAFCQDPDLDDTPIAHGYDDGRDVGLASEHSYGWEYRGMGGVLTSMADLYRWHVALQGDLILNDEAKDKYWTPNLASCACGWFVMETVDGFPWAPPGIAYQRHGGTVAGFSIEIMRLPDRNGIIAVACNEGGSRLPSTLMYNIAGRILTDRYYMPLPPQTVTWPADQLDPLTGTYTLANADGRLAIQRKNNGLLIAPLDSKALQVLKHTPEWGTELQELAGLAERIVQGINAGDGTLLAETRMNRIPDNWPIQQKRWGAVNTITAVQCRKVGPRAVEVIVLADCERGYWPIRVTFRAGRLDNLDLEYTTLPGQHCYLPTEDGTFVTFEPTPGSNVPLPTLTFSHDTETGAPTIRMHTVDGEKSGNKVE